MMLMAELPGAGCKQCGGDVIYGVKQETSSDKVYVDCDDCGREAMAGRVDKDASQDDVLETAHRAPHVHSR